MHDNATVSYHLFPQFYFLVNAKHLNYTLESFHIYEEAKAENKINAKLTAKGNQGYITTRPLRGIHGTTTKEHTPPVK